MNRRVFLTTLISTAGLVTLKLRSQATEIIFPDIKRLNAGDVVVVNNGSKMCLPLHPKDGDTIQFVVDRDALETPGTIEFEENPIAGDKDSLVLDSIANFKLTFKSLSNSWELA